MHNLEIVFTFVVKMRRWEETLIKRERKKKKKEAIPMQPDSRQNADPIHFSI